MEIKSKLEKVIINYNNALRNLVKEEFHKRMKAGWLDVQIKMLDFRSAGQISLRINEKNELVFCLSGRKENDNTYINYYWIEYEFEDEIAQKKVTFFYKDIDTDTCNIHVIPGVIQEWIRINEQRLERENLPRLVIKDGMKMINLPSGKKYLPFIEEDWRPVYCENNAINTLVKERKTVKDYEELRKCFRCVEKEERKKIREELKLKNVDILRGGLATSSKYEFIMWNNMKRWSKERESYYSINLFKVVYFKGIGIFTVYNYVSFTPAAKPKDGKESNRINFRKKDETAVDIHYDMIPVQDKKEIYDFFCDNNRMLSRLKMDELRKQFEHYLAADSD